MAMMLASRPPAHVPPAAGRRLPGGLRGAAQGGAGAAPLDAPPQAAALASTVAWLALAAGAAGARRWHKFSSSSGRRSTATRRRAVELPVKEAPVETTVAIPGAKVSEESKQKRADQYRLLLFNDPLNKREFVARCLITIALLKESDAYQVMMKAHTEGVAVVGTYQFETAEAYCEGLKAKGLAVDIIPVDGDDA
mmetsp:Transcript_36778/g.83206  ORF Transcript_36778/g.83206 Transcript_36778/m.83206 type:complete len:195 (-) Transcript_36778:165-749(-)